MLYRIQYVLASLFRILKLVANESIAVATIKIKFTFTLIYRNTNILTSFSHVLNLIAMSQFQTLQWKQMTFIFVFLQFYFHLWDYILFVPLYFLNLKNNTLFGIFVLIGFARTKSSQFSMYHYPWLFARQIGGPKLVKNGTKRNTEVALNPENS